MILTDVRVVEDPLADVSLECCWLIGEAGTRWVGVRYGDEAYFSDCPVTDRFYRYEDAKIIGNLTPTWIAAHVDSALVAGILRVYADNGLL